MSHDPDTELVVKPRSSLRCTDHTVAVATIVMHRALHQVTNRIALTDELPLPRAKACTTTELSWQPGMQKYISVVYS